jgi:hypothetical protein
LVGGVRAVALVVAGLAAGCGLTSNQKTTLKSFGKSTASYGATVATLAPSALDTIDQMRADNLSFATPSSRSAFKHAAEKGMADYLHNQKAREHVAMMVAVASALDDYGKALLDLAAYGDSDERLATFADIAGQLDQTFGMPAAKDTATAVGHAASFVTTQVLEAIKRRDIAGVVRSWDPAVKSACELLTAEFKGEHEGTLFFAYKDALGAFSDRMPQPEKLAKNPPPGGEVQDSPAALADAEGRRQIVAAQREYVLRMAAFESVQKAGIASTAALAKAHAELVAAMSNNLPSAGALADFAKSAASLYNEFTSGK